MINLGQIFYFPILFSILVAANKGLVISQNQLNNLNITMTDLIRKQSVIKAQRKIATLPEEALESVITLREELHRDILALTPDLDKRQSACEILENFLYEKFNSCKFVDISGNFEEIVDANLSGVEDITPTREDSPIFINNNIIINNNNNNNNNEISSITTDDDSLPPPPSIDASDESPIPINISDHMSHIEMVTDSIPMIDETPSSESFDDVCFNQPTIILVKPNVFQKWTQPETNDEKEEIIVDLKPVQKTGTILKSGTSQFPVGPKSSRTNKVVFCNTVTVEDGSETIRLNCPSEESDLEEQPNILQSMDDQGTIRKNPPPPPPRRTSQISSGVDSADGDINYENLESFSSDMRHHILHHNLVCVPLTVKSPASVQTAVNHSTEHANDKRRLDSTNTKQSKLKPLPCPSENDVWQRQTEFNTPASRSAPATNKSNTKSSGDSTKPKTEKSNKKK